MWRQSEWARDAGPTSNPLVSVCRPRASFQQTRTELNQPIRRLICITCTSASASASVSAPASASTPTYSAAYQNFVPAVRVCNETFSPVCANPNSQTTNETAWRHLRKLQLLLLRGCDINAMVSLFKEQTGAELLACNQTDISPIDTAVLSIPGRQWLYASPSVVSHIGTKPSSFTSRARPYGDCC